MAEGGQPESRRWAVKLGWDEIHGIMKRAVKRGLARRQADVVGEIGVDEKAFRKGHRSRVLRCARRRLTLAA
jgi:hypothetical protein